MRLVHGFMPPPKRGADDSEDWMVTYADAVTLLLTFFVMLLSISDINPKKYEEIQSAIVQEMAHRDTQQPFTQLGQNLADLAASKELGEMDMNVTPRGLVLEFTGSTLYAPGSAELGAEAQKILRRVAQQIKTLGRVEYRVVVEGHTDDVPIHTPQFPSNWELSTQRATTVVRFLIQEGIPPYRLQAAGFADTKPKLPNRDASGRAIPQNQARNRRVIIAITPGGGGPEF